MLFSFYATLIAQSTYSIQSNTDYFGNDIATYTVNTMTECQSYCDNNPICVGFVMSVNSTGCWIKSSFDISNPSKRKISFKKPVFTNLLPKNDTFDKFSTKSETKPFTNTTTTAENSTPQNRNPVSSITIVYIILFVICGLIVFGMAFYLCLKIRKSKNQNTKILDAISTKSQSIYNSSDAFKNSNHKRSLSGDDFLYKMDVESLCSTVVIEQEQEQAEREEDVAKIPINSKYI